MFISFIGKLQSLCNTPHCCYSYFVAMTRIVTITGYCFVRKCLGLHYLRFAVLDGFAQFSKQLSFFNDGYCRKWVFSNLHRSLCKLTRSSFQFLKSVFFSFDTVQFIVTNVWPEMYIITDASTDTLTYRELHSSLSLLSFSRYFVRWIDHSVAFDRLWFACSVFQFVVVYAIVSSEPSSKFQMGLFA